MFVIVILAEISVHLTAFFNQMLAFNFQKSTMFFFFPDSNDLLLHIFQRALSTLKQKA